MRTLTFIRWTGLIVMVGAVLNLLVQSALPWATVSAAGYTRDLSPADRAFGLNEFDYGWLQVIVLACFLTGLVALGLAHRGRLGTRGKLGYGIALLGLLIALGGSFFEYWMIHDSIFMRGLVDQPKIRAMWGTGWALSHLGRNIFYVGLLPLGVAVLRAQRLAPWARVVPLGLALLGIFTLSLFLFSLAFMFDQRIPDTHFLRNIWLMQVWFITSSVAWGVMGLGLWTLPTRQHQ